MCNRRRLVSPALAVGDDAPKSCMQSKLLTTQDQEFSALPLALRRTLSLDPVDRVLQYGGG